MLDIALGGGGEMGRLMRAKDWRRTALGPVEDWPQSLLTSVSTCLNSRFPILIWWGADLVMLYNDAYMPILGAKHPESLGQGGRQCWPEIWPIIGPMLDGVISTGAATWSEDQLLLLRRHGFAEECYFTFSYSPIRVESGGVGGIFTAVTETTGQVLSKRRLRTLREIAVRTSGAKSDQQACESAAAALGEDAADLPFALIYLRRESEAVLTCSAGPVVRGGPGAPERVALPWTAPWDQAGGKALVLPMVRSGEGQGQGGPYGYLVAGLSERLFLDEGYRGFLELVAGQVAAALTNVRALQEAEERAAALAEIDRAKTLFFSNISHEFRTPLTLMLGPTEDALRLPQQALAGEALLTVYRNQLRLLKLVNTLLDFSRMEAGRMQAVFEPTDLGALTAELSGHFQSAVESAGLYLRIQAPPQPGPAYVDREMWEKIVLNLLSNAFKFTFSGGITVTVGVVDGRFEVAVRDTGIGIPQAELPHLFKRFHRVEGVRSRSHEGSGIGLALVQELVHQHGGQILVDSVEGQGTTFTVSLPVGLAHLPQQALGHRHEQAQGGAGPILQEAQRWRADREDAFVEQGPADPRGHDGGLVLVVDDNADMRNYVGRILGQRFQVEVAADGAAALAAARRRAPELVLTDVMMPHLDGFGLLRALRADPGLSHVPVIMLSARAGSEARVDGLGAGADDYLEKPFSAPELVARVQVHLELGRLRRRLEAEVAEQIRVRQQVETLAAAAQESERRKDEFLAMLAHELRNPLTPICTGLSLLRRLLKEPAAAGPDREAAERHVALIERQTTSLVRIVDDLLDVSRVTKGKIELHREPVEVQASVLAALESAREALQGRGHEVTRSLPAQGLHVMADPVRLEQILVNLLTNAAKYTEPGGRIQVLVEQRGAEVALVVRDNGVGIPAGMLDRVFNLFEQAGRDLGRAQGGLGIGLTIVRRLVELHGGTIVAGSGGAGQGSEFTVRLPLLVPAAPAQQAPALAPEVVSSAGLRVLVVDDNVDIAASMGELLEDLGYAVRLAHSGQEALRAVEADRPDVVLLDIGLPGMDGYAVARELLRHAAPPLLVAVTGYGQGSDRQRVQEAGFFAHLVKPAPLSALERVLAEVAARKGTRAA